MNLQQFLLILRARASVIAWMTVVTVATALLVSLVLPKKYTATAAVVVDVKSPDPIAGMVLPGLISPGYMSTQVDIINSDRVALRVVKRLHLADNPEFRERWISATNGKGSIDEWIAAQLQDKLEVKPSHDSSVVNIDYTATDPAFAAAVANGFAQAYLDVNLDLKVQPARQYSAWFDEQTRIARARLEGAQTALTLHQQKTGIVATDERLDYEISKLNDLSTQLTVVQGQTADSHSKQKSAGGSDSLPEVMQSPLIQTLKEDIAHLEGKLQDSNVNLGKNHPQTQRMESELASLKARMQAEVRQISSGISTSVQVGRQKEVDLLAAIDAQKHKLLELNKQRDELSVLKRDVDSAQKTLEAVNERSMQSKLESQTIQTNIAVLTPASEPTLASRPKVLRNVALSVVLGLMAGVALALMLEFSNRRLRSVDDLAQTLGLPVLAEVSSLSAHSGAAPVGVLARVKHKLSGRRSLAQVIH